MAKNFCDVSSLQLKQRMNEFPKLSAESKIDKEKNYKLLKNRQSIFLKCHLSNC